MISSLKGQESVEFTTVEEGLASILFPKKNCVFYNPVQQFNRDLSVVAIRAWGDEWQKKKHDGMLQKASKMEKNIHQESSVDSNHRFTILEALSATGLRAIRYAKEIPNVKQVLANDISSSAIEAINRNIEYNKASEIVIANKGDASATMYSHRSQSSHFNVVDLDPYGSAAPFLDGAVQCVANGGLLLVTCTDVAVLAGSGYPEKCFASYGGSPAKAEFCHEAALRLVLSAIALSAARYGKAIEPLLCLSIDFYVRLFVRLKYSPASVKMLPSTSMITYICSGCGSWVNQPLGRVVEKPSIKFSNAPGPTASQNCQHCGFKSHIAGPMWAGSLHNKEFVSRMIEIAKQLDPKIYSTRPRMEGLLTLALEELAEPFFFTPSRLASKLHSSTPPLNEFLSALLNAGFKVSASHCIPGSIKTNASHGDLWNIMKQWVIENPIKKEQLKDGTVAKNILEKNDSSLKVSFEEHPGIAALGRKTKLVRYQMNPTKNWGPGTKSKKKTLPESDLEAEKRTRDDLSHIDGKPLEKKPKIGS